MTWVYNLAKHRHQSQLFQPQTVRHWTSFWFPIYLVLMPTLAESGSQEPWRVCEFHLYWHFMVLASVYLPAHFLFIWFWAMPDQWKDFPSHMAPHKDPWGQWHQPSFEICFPFSYDLAMWGGHMDVLAPATPLWNLVALFSLLQGPA